MDVLKKWAVEKGKLLVLNHLGLDVTNFEKLVGSPELMKAVIESMEAKAKEYGLNSLEKIRKIHLTL